VLRDGQEGLDRALTGGFDAVITEYRLPGAGGLQVISTLHTKKPRLPVLLVTGARDGDVAIRAVKGGAYDYLPKPVDVEELCSVLEEAVAAVRQMAKPVEIGRVYEEQDTLIGSSRAMARVYRELAKIAATPVTVLIRGETGTGKELIARALYQHGHRAHKPFITVNCAAIPENLLESELFGHEKGAFTGAVSTRIGKLSRRTARRSFWMRSATWTCTCRPSCCACSRSARSRGSEDVRTSRWTCGSLPRRTGTLRK
jgi:DNA-binding NtrC family response regulator